MNAAPFTIEAGIERRSFTSMAECGVYLKMLYDRVTAKSQDLATSGMELGQALAQVRDRFPHGSWERFVRSQGIKVNTARWAIRKWEDSVAVKTEPNKDITVAMAQRNYSGIPNSSNVPDAVECSRCCVGCGCTINEGVACEDCQQTLGDEPDHESDIENGAGDADDLYFGPARDQHAAGGAAAADSGADSDASHKPEQYIEAGRAVIAGRLERAAVGVNHAPVAGSEADQNFQAQDTSASRPMPRPTQMTFDAIFEAAESRIAKLSDAGRAFFKSRLAARVEEILAEAEAM